MYIQQHFIRGLLIGAFAATFTFAQSGGSTTSQAMVGKNDETFMTKAAMGGMAEVQMAQMAQQKASSQEIKDYARMLEKDHSDANEKLKGIAQQRQVSLPADIGPEHSAVASKLNTLTGEQFDRAYVRMMIQDHRKDIKVFEKASTRSMDSDLKNFASGALPTLREHLKHVEQLDTSTRSHNADKLTGASNMDKSSNASAAHDSSHPSASGAGTATPVKP